jgi:hypothetical protein
MATDISRASTLLDPDLDRIQIAHLLLLYGVVHQAIDAPNDWQAASVFSSLDIVLGAFWTNTRKPDDNYQLLSYGIRVADTYLHIVCIFSLMGHRSYHPVDYCIKRSQHALAVLRQIRDSLLTCH